MLDLPPSVRGRRSGAWAAALLSIGVTGWLGGPSPAAAATRATDCSVHADGRLYCANRADAKLYLDPGYSAPVTGTMHSTYSWFSCWQHGEMHPGRNDIWYWTKGDVPRNGYSGWGFMPAYDLRTSGDPAPGLAQCSFR
jgi:hypothetical protein